MQAKLQPLFNHDIDEQLDTKDEPTAHKCDDYLHHRKHVEESKRATPKKGAKTNMESTPDKELEQHSHTSKKQTSATPRDGLRLLQTKSTTGKKGGKQ